MQEASLALLLKRTAQRDVGAVSQEPLRLAAGLGVSSPSRE